MPTIPNLSSIPTMTDDDLLVTHDVTTNRTGRIPALSVKNFVLSGFDADVPSSNITFGADNLESVLLEQEVSPESQGGVGDGVSNDTTAVNSAVTTAKDEVHLKTGKKYLVTSVNNPLGKQFVGKGAVVKAATGGLEQQNTYAADYQTTSGLENLAAWYKLLYDQHVTPTRQLRIVFSGDSTTAGVGVDSPYTIPNLILTEMTNRGLQSPYNTAVINNGHSGAHTGQWETTYVSADIAAAPDLFILRWGINDPGWLKSGSPAPLDAGQSYPNRRDLTDYLTSLRNGLATFRASKNFATTSIVLMTPNSTYDIPNGRDALWYEQLRDGVLQAAKDFQCAFIDTYALTQNSKPLANILMDDPFADGRGIHPNNIFNAYIAGVLADAIVPVGFRANLATNKIFAIGGAGLTPSAALAPSAWGAAIYMARALTGQGFPLDGNVLTFCTPDDTVLQYLFGFSNANRGVIKFRQGRKSILAGEAADWSSWYDLVINGGTTTVTPASGYTLPGSGGMRVSFTGTSAVFEGYINKTAAAIIPINTTVATIPTGYRPSWEAAYCVATVWDGSVFEQVPARVTTSGNIETLKATTLLAQRVYIQCSYNNRA